MSSSQNERAVTRELCEERRQTMKECIDRVETRIIETKEELAADIDEMNKNLQRTIKYAFTIAGLILTGIELILRFA